MEDIAEWMTLKPGIIKSLYIFKFSSAKITQASTAAAGIKQLFSYVRHSKEILQALQDPTGVSAHSNIFLQTKKNYPASNACFQVRRNEFSFAKQYIFLP